MDTFFSTAEDPAARFRQWGPEHLCLLCICLLVSAVLCRCYCQGTPAIRARLRLGIGWTVLGSELAKELNLALHGMMGVYFLPLHLCGLAVFFTLAHALRRNALLGELLYSTCMPGAVFALLFPDWTGFGAFSFQSLNAFLVHTLLTVYPLMQVLGGDLRPDFRRLPGCLGILLALASAVYAVDRALSANYMFLLQPAPGSPLEWFAGILGNPGYLLGYFPMLAGIWLLLYLPFFVSRKVRKERNGTDMQGRK